MQKRIFSLVFVLMLVIMIFSGCQKKQTSSSPSKNGSDSVGDSSDAIVDSMTDDSELTNSGDGTVTSSNGIVPSQSKIGNTTGKPNKVVTGASSFKKPTEVLTGTSNLKGATIKYAAGLPLTNKVKKQIADFKNKYGVKSFQTDVLGYMDYIQNLTMAAAAGTYYDIVQLEAFRFPQICISDLLTPLDKVVSANDYGTGKLNKEDSDFLKWKGHLYGVCARSGEFGGHLTVLYYNRLLLEDAGCKDPRDLYEKGQWNFDTFYEMGEKVRDYYKGRSVFMTSLDTLQRSTYWNGAEAYDWSKNPPKATLDSQRNINAFKFIQKCVYGPNAIAAVSVGGSGAYASADAFAKGTIAVTFGADFDLYENCFFGDRVVASNAFKKKVSNMGMVPPPLGPDNKEKSYGLFTGLYGISAGIGTKNPRIAVEFARFSAGYEWKNTTNYKWSAKDQQLINTLRAGKTQNAKASFSDGNQTDINIAGIAKNEVAKGADVAQTVKKYNQQLQKCIDVTLSQK